MTATDPSTRPRIGPPVPYDPELAAALAVVRAEMPRLDSFESLAVVREAVASRQLPLEDLTADGTIELWEVEADGPDGPVPAIVGRPAGVTTAVPVLYWLHGGGMVLGGNRGRDLLFLKQYARELGLAFVAIDYRVAPEHPHPAPVEDCYAGLKWTVEHAAEFGIDPERVLVGGASAGGGWRPR